MLGPLSDLVNALPDPEHRQAANLARRNALRADDYLIKFKTQGHEDRSR